MTHHEIFRTPISEDDVVAVKYPFLIRVQRTTTGLFWRLRDDSNVDWVHTCRVDAAASRTQKWRLDFFYDFF